MTCMTQTNNPLHGIKLEALLTELVESLGWEQLASEINIRCFSHDPSIKSSLKFLRKQQWARDKVEALYLSHKGIKADQSRRVKQPNRSAITFNSNANQQHSTKQGVNAHIWGKK